MLVVVRHGERADKVTNSGWAGGDDPPLTARGWRQAVATGILLAKSHAESNVLVISRFDPGS